MRRGENKTLEMSNHWRELEIEYDEPMRDIIMGFREQGCSWETIASVLEVAHSTLIRWRDYLDIPTDGRMNYESKYSKAEDVARQMGYKNFEAMFRDLRVNQKMTLKEIARKTGLAESTLSEKAPEPLRFHWVQTDALKESRLKNIAIGRRVLFEKRQALK